MLKALIVTGLLATIHSTYSASLDSKAKETDKPNILFIMADDLGYNDIGYNNREVKSPNLDRLAREGLILENNYMQHSCTPSRAAFLTGISPFKMQLQHMVLGESMPHCAPTNIKFLGERFQERGYNTYAVGKWHLGFCKKACLPTNRGFDRFYGCYAGQQDYYTHMAGEGYDWRDDDNVDKSASGTYHSNLVNDYVIKALKKQNPSDRFFMYVSFTNVHTPLQAPERFINMYRDIPDEGRRTYLAMMTAMDESVGNIVNALKALDMYDNTIIIFSSDNGGEDGGNADNTPLRGGKASLYEGGARVVGFVHSPLLKTPRVQHKGIFHVTDWTNTLMGMVGGAVDSSLDGYDQSDMILNGGPSKRKELIYNIDMQPGKLFGQAAVRMGDYKLIWGHPGYVDGRGRDLVIFFKNPDNVALVDGTEQAHTRSGAVDMTPEDIRVLNGLEQLWSFHPDNITSGWAQLFNLADDPNEYKDLSEDPNEAYRVYVMKKYILKNLKDYVAPHAEASSAWVEESDPAKFGGAWTTGWCNHVDILI